MLYARPIEVLFQDTNCASRLSLWRMRSPPCGEDDSAIVVSTNATQFKVSAYVLYETYARMHTYNPKYSPFYLEYRITLKVFSAADTIIVLLSTFFVHCFVIFCSSLGRNAWFGVVESKTRNTVA